eukprot:CAMPEP_0118799666 /NCGR_PEP_ID=MMETSP1161-20130426/1819_1 /TAXON_ID=249345 /ORGANISM="Picochlorum oklahomensis, Strain CCMP2329" /LENGTH=351 /DNA_ID=CAMNT_0006727403 /DNA_START=15 /DNA_END=1070 /DNA_ORIENTATION=-
MEHVQNAVGFLSHPKVRASSEASKRSFLVGKGLTEAEIEEAFRRVPQDGSKDDSSPLQTPGVLPGDQGRPQGTVMPQSQQMPESSSRGYSWTNVLLGMGFAAAAAYSIKSIFGPSIARGFKAWKSPEKDGDTTAKREEDEKSELVEAVREQTELMRKSLESLQILIESQNTISSYQAMSELTEEVRHLAHRLEGRSGLADSSVVDSAKHPVSYMEVLEMLEKGETPPGIRDDIDDKPPEPDMSPPVSKLKPVPKPWHDLEPGQDASSSLSVSVRNKADDTPSRRDLSGERPGSILESAMTPPEKSPSVVMEKQYSKSPMNEGFEGSGLGRPASSAWKPPPLPTPLSFDGDE